MAGIPWWGAVVLAVTAAAVGFAYDAGSGGKTLSAAFSLCYAAGCVFAVLLVRQSGVFTAVIQPPLVLFVTVPTAYFVLTGGELKGIKNSLISCGYPLIERFPLMFFTSGIVLLIGMVRWYFSAAAKRRLADGGEIADTPSDSRLAAATTTLLPAATPTPRRSRKTWAERAGRAAPAAEQTEEPRRKSAKASTAKTGTPRSRHNRPPDTEIVEPVAAARGERRPRSSAPVEPPAEARRRIRSTPPEPRRTPPTDRRNPYDRPERSERPLRGDRPDRYDRAERPERADRGERRRRPPTDYEPLDGHSQGAANGRNGSSGSHHPVSRVRYRASDDGEPPSPQRTRPREWDYDA